MPTEFDLIARYFTRPAANAVLGVGDDAALLRPAPGMDLVVSTDMLVACRHFLPDTDPYRLGHKTLAVNLSDLAAMGAIPRWATLALALPEADEAWIEAFSRGLHDLADRFGVSLIGGDTTRGPLNLCVTVLGEVEAGRALRRDGAQDGDDIWVSGELGAAAIGLQHLLGKLHLHDLEALSCTTRLETPEPRIVLGRALGGVAHAAIDLSDGLLADLGHILERSAVGAEIDLGSLPAHPAIGARPTDAIARHCLLAGGDDYELCFTAPATVAEAVLLAGGMAGVAVTRIGRITRQAGLRGRDANGRIDTLDIHGFDHFAD